MKIGSLVHRQTYPFITQPVRAVQEKQKHSYKKNNFRVCVCVCVYKGCLQSVTRLKQTSDYDFGEQL